MKNVSLLYTLVSRGLQSYAQLHVVPANWPRAPPSWLTQHYFRYVWSEPRASAALAVNVNIYT